MIANDDLNEMQLRKPERLIIAFSEYMPNNNTTVQHATANDGTVWVRVIAHDKEYIRPPAWYTESVPPLPQP
jgi:hypothetical protein